MSNRYMQFDCRSCTLSNAMRDCMGCEFFVGQPQDERRNARQPMRATSADVFRMYRLLWDDCTPDDVREVAQLDPTWELVDSTQVPLWMIEV